jgi:hypothetical protein
MTSVGIIQKCFLIYGPEDKDKFDNERVEIENPL